MVQRSLCLFAQACYCTLTLSSWGKSKANKYSHNISYMLLRVCLLLKHFSFSYFYTSPSLKPLIWIKTKRAHLKRSPWGFFWFWMGSYLSLRNSYFKYGPTIPYSLTSIADSLCAYFWSSSIFGWQPVNTTEPLVWMWCTIPNRRKRSLWRPFLKRRITGLLKTFKDCLRQSQSPFISWLWINGWFWELGTPMTWSRQIAWHMIHCLRSQLWNGTESATMDKFLQTSYAMELVDL